MATLPMYIVEAFTIGANQPFTGNTAGVCVLEYDDDISDDLKQNIGMQMNYSETAFIAQGWSRSDPFHSTKTNRWSIRWFTPTIEIGLCGYATLAASNVLFNEILKKRGLVDTSKVKETTVVYETKTKGQLEATMDWTTGLIALNFPSNAPIPVAEAEAELTNNNMENSWVNKLIKYIVGPNVDPGLVDDVQVAEGIEFVLLRLKDSGDPEKNKQLLTQIQPDFKSIVALKTGSVKMLATVVTIQGWTQLSKDKPQFFSRIFGPKAGIDEDPVCGSAHTILMPYWVDQFRQQGVDIKDKEVIGLQLSERKGEFLCSMIGEDRVKMVGQTRLTFSGEFYPA